MKGRIVHEDANTRIWLQEFSGPGEHTDFLENLKISQEFNMRHRGLMLFYGQDFIAYKKEQKANKKRNEFLQTLSHYMTDHLEDDCPSSWEECPASFWEELIFAYLPHYTKIIPEKNYTETFLLQLRTFVRWLDKRKGTSFTNLVEDYIIEGTPILKKCEALLNHLFLKDYPRFHQSDWDYEGDQKRWEQSLEKYSNTIDGMFRVTAFADECVILKDLHTHHTYMTKSLPVNKLSTTTIITGILGQKPHELVWDWLATINVFPEKGEKYIRNAK
ncbi:hypothetical protein LCM10_20430 [Rossellomorea aquimaris]|uniref:hypothetical protein n=1 Tax=Rossellomorea aquimaris TaxID=189382 RepID=UPI001CD3999D|nr:hypothetical protein [Rossellomorea aquimaris]MCA1057313.1 hypothetical protein [Rossellomorea aquimaris]